MKSNSKLSKLKLLLQYLIDYTITAYMIQSGRSADGLE